MTQNQIAYHNMLIAQENANSNALQAKAAMQQAEIARMREGRSKSETLWEGITSGISNLGGLLFGIFGGGGEK